MICTARKVLGKSYRMVSDTAASTAGGYPILYPIVAANLLGWSARNVVRDGIRISYPTLLMLLLPLMEMT
ncbi:unnamed protein product [Adineta ricciae]|uniref:Uncharacterized protein n=1 Tax=Adineta ricciae TaxID=249248 RepID=A0A814FL30_ADIRI|nr:unnamed protein product [Adineta ricciae]